MLGPMEIGIIAAITLLIFGPKQIPKMGKALGDTLREFRGIGRELAGAQDAAEDAGRSIAREVRQVIEPATPATAPRRHVLGHVYGGLQNDRGDALCQHCGDVENTRHQRRCPARNGAGA
jgi:sec-independent protein translocase protein TatA